MSSSSYNCSICDNKIGNRRYSVECFKCEYLACKDCLLTWFNSDTIENIICPNCKVIWDRKFRYEMFNIVDNKRIDNTVKEFLWKQELIRMPEALEFAKQKVHQERQKHYVKMEEDIFRDLQKKDSEIDVNEIKKINFIKRKIMKYGRYELKNKEKAVFVSRCSVEGCNGYVSTRYKCEKCGTYTCSECGCVKEENHICDPNEVLSYKEVKSDSKPCPSCGIAISKIEGCNQMWCTKCNTGFDWRTGHLIQRGNIHNPHYFDYIRNDNNDLNLPLIMDECGNIIFSTQDFFSYRNNNHFMNFIRLLNHYDEISRVNNIYNDQTNLDKRMSLMIGEIDEENFRRTIMMRYKKYEKKKNYNDIIKTFVIVSTEILKLLKNGTINFNDMIEKLREILDFTNVKITESCKIYGKKNTISINLDLILLTQQEI